MLIWTGSQGGGQGAEPGPSCEVPRQGWGGKGRASVEPEVRARTGKTNTEPRGCRDRGENRAISKASCGKWGRHRVQTAARVTPLPRPAPRQSLQQRG